MSDRGTLNQSLENVLPESPVAASVKLVNPETDKSDVKSSWETGVDNTGLNTLANLVASDQLVLKKPVSCQISMNV